MPHYDNAPSQVDCSDGPDPTQSHAMNVILKRLAASMFIFRRDLLKVAFGKPLSLVPSLAGIVRKRISRLSLFEGRYRLRQVTYGTLPDHGSTVDSARQ